MIESIIFLTDYEKLLCCFLLSRIKQLHFFRKYDKIGTEKRNPVAAFMRKKERKGNPMLQREEKIRVGKISAWIILILSIISIVYKLFGFHFTIMTAIVNLIDDASACMTVICISFGITAMLGKSKSPDLLFLCLIDILLINRLYSNSTWYSIGAWIEGLDESIWFLGAVICFFLLYLVYKIGSRRRKQSREYHSVEEDQSLEYIIRMSLTTICLGIVVWGVLDYAIFHWSLFQIERPALLAWLPETLYYGVILSIAILITQYLTKLLHAKGKPKKKIWFAPISNFRMSAFFAILIEIAWIFFVYKSNVRSFVSRIWTTVTDNWILAIFLFLFFFFILQIVIMLVLNLFRKGEEPSKDGTVVDKIVTELGTYITEIELKMVKLACNAIKGFVNLFDFIPDFFSAIGLLLLDQQEMDNEKEKQQENSQTEQEEKETKEEEKSEEQSDYSSAFFQEGHQE